MRRQNAPETLRAGAIVEATRLVHVLLSHGPVVVIHGAGSFGHFQAAKYALHRGFDGEIPPEALLGVADLRRALTGLNHLLVRLSGLLTRLMHGY